MAVGELTPFLILKLNLILTLKLGFPQCLSDFLVPGANCPLVEEGTTPRGEQPKILFYERHCQ